MEKYQEIYNYLQTFPKETTVGQLIKNMDKAELDFMESQKRQIQNIENEFVGNTYYYEELYNGKVVCKYITKIKEFTINSIKDMIFSCELITITKTDIHYEKLAHVDIKGLKMAKKIPNEIFDNAKESFDSFYNIWTNA